MQTISAAYSVRSLAPRCRNPKSENSVRQVIGQYDRRRSALSFDDPALRDELPAKLQLLGDGESERPVGRSANEDRPRQQPRGPRWRAPAHRPGARSPPARPSGGVQSIVVFGLDARGRCQFESAVHRGLSRADRPSQATRPARHNLLQLTGRASGSLTGRANREPKRFRVGSILALCRPAG